MSADTIILIVTGVIALGVLVWFFFILMKNMGQKIEEHARTVEAQTAASAADSSGSAKKETEESEPEPVDPEADTDAGTTGDTGAIGDTGSSQQ